ncbi:MAG: hypothetical protein RML99_00020 [Anaerolineae bacterium]|nr:hypothetical protein [Anaerolineales bacterium]MDW8350267.1 hypothetical protein [Anaerolineae bacterium]
MNDGDRFFAQLYEAFNRAAQGSLTQHTLCVSGRPVRLLIAGEGMMALWPALAHLIATNDDNDDYDYALTICLWDSATTGISPPPPPWDTDQYGRHGEIRAFNTAALRFAFDLGRGMLYAWSAMRKLALCWTSEAHHLPAYERGAPLLPIWHWWLSAMGDALLHAAAVSSDGSGVLIVGRGGSGKSTTALACLSAGMDYLGDDYCAVTLGPQPHVHSLFCTAKLHHDNLHRLPCLRHTRRLSEEEKVIFDLRAEFADRLARCCELRAILVPAFSNCARPSLEPVSSALALRALAPSTLFQLAASGAADFERIAALVKRTPCYRLWLGEEVGAMSDIILELLGATRNESQRHHPDIQPS